MLAKCEMCLNYTCLIIAGIVFLGLAYFFKTEFPWDDTSFSMFIVGGVMFLVCGIINVFVYWYQRRQDDFRQVGVINDSSIPMIRIV